MRFQVREKTTEDLQWLIPYMRENWGSGQIVTKNELHDVTELLGFIAEQNRRPVGVALYELANNECELLLLASFIHKVGIGSTLIEHVKRAAADKGCKRIWLVTTNDNLAAIRFYQLRGFSLAALYKNALEEARKLKPEIPLVGIDGIPLRDEVELEVLL